jgi:hypothetical protein
VVVEMEDTAEAGVLRVVRKRASTDTSILVALMPGMEANGAVVVDPAFPTEEMEDSVEAEVAVATTVRALQG